jgi:hypothetical protein
MVNASAQFSKGDFVNADDAAHFTALMLQSGFSFVSRMFQTAKR